MRAYFAVTGVLFGCVTILHLARMPEIRQEYATQPSYAILYLALTLVSAALCGWAWTLFARSMRAGK